MYSITIAVHDPSVARKSDLKMSDYPTSLTISANGVDQVGSTFTFATKDEAIAYALGSIEPKISGETRAPNPGEISAISMLDFADGANTHGEVFDPRTGD